MASTVATMDQEHRGRSRDRSRDSISSLRGYGLVTIVEEAEADDSRKVWPGSPSSRSNRLEWLRAQEQQLSQKIQQHRRKGLMVPHLDIDGWLSPMSDHFPTPRGFHFLPAPILPATPSISSFDPATDDRDAEDDADSCTGTDSTEFDDLCDLSDGDESEGEAAKAFTARAFLPQLVIPSRQASSTLATDGIDSAKDKDQDLHWMEVAHMPSTVQLSPETIEMMERHQSGPLPDISAPPSLDGSLDSDQLAGLSSPPTPMLGPEDKKTSTLSDSPMSREPSFLASIRLEPAALATLHALSVGAEDEDEDDLSIDNEEEQGIIEIALEQPPQMSETRSATLRLMTQLNRNSMPADFKTPDSAASSASRLPELTKLEIPSPGAFFAGLTPGARHTWGAGPTSASTLDDESLSSVVAERFYRTPWDEQRSQQTPHHEREPLYRKWFTSGPPVEHIIEIPVAHDEEDQPTARPINTAVRMEALASPGRQSEMGDGLEAIEIILEADPIQARQQQSVALAQLDRMEAWLAAQRAYLPSMQTEDDNEGEDDTAEYYREIKVQPPPFRLSSSQSTDKPLPNLPTEDTEVAKVVVMPGRKKSVRFSVQAKRAPIAPAGAKNIPREIPSTLYRQESAYYRSFINHMIRQRPGDVFVHRQPRFEALQAQRATLHESHRRQLLGKFQLSVVPQSARMRRLSANVARGDDEPASPSDDDVARIRRDQEADAAGQMAVSLWHVAASKMLAGGRLVRAPVAKRLGRMSRMAPGPDGVPRDRARILDLGGQAACDWAWHCAHAYPNTKIYTVTTREARQLANSNIRGPPNHRHVAVEKLSRLPFADASFDLVSARELHALLKSSGANGEDEWDACLAEVMRVLKPGGYLDFSLLDSDMISPGPRGLAKSVEFGFALKTLGYDPTPTRAWLGRLHRAGFGEVRRAWTCLPMGGKPGPAKSDSPTVPDTDNGAVAAVAGLMASWTWERWLLRCETERLASERRLCAAETATCDDAVRDAAARCLGDVHAIVEEGRACGAAWRMLTGWAQKPRL